MVSNIGERHRAHRDKHGGQWFDFEQIVREVYRSTLKPGDTAIDAGANFGGHTMQMADLVGASGRVVAIEAVPFVAQALQRSIGEGYGHLAARIEIVNRAVSDSPGTKEFYHVASNPALSSFVDRPNVDAAKTLITVETVRIDDLVRPDDVVTYMKLDVEGAELAALKGATRVLTTHRPVITFEYDVVTSSAFGNTAEDYLNVFAAHGYRIFDPFGGVMQKSDDFQDSLVWDYIAMSCDCAREKQVMGNLAAYMQQHFGVNV